MTLEYDAATGEHTFRPPERPYVGPQDALGRTAQLGALVTRPIGPARYSQPVPVKNTKYMEGYEVVSFQCELYDERGTWQQAGPFSEAHANYSENELVADAPDIMRHPFKVGQEPATNGEWVNPAAVSTAFTRMCSAFFRNKLFVGETTADGIANTNRVYSETSATNPVMTKVTTYAPLAGNAIILCMSVVICGGSTYLFIGYGNGAGAALGCEAFILATLAAPIQVDTSNGHTGAVAGVSGIIQAPNGDILVAGSNGDLKLATNNTAAPGALSFTTMQTQALGFFPVAIGPCSLSNYAPGALWWASIEDGNEAYYAANINANGTDATPKGRLILSSYDCLTLDPIDFPDLPYVSFATIYRGGPVACDRKSHYWYTGAAMKSMDGGSDRPANSHKHRLCCGHMVVGDKFVRIEAESDDRFVAAHPNTSYNTFARVIEYDPYLGRERPISKRIDLGFGGNSLVVGANPSLPFSPLTRNIHWFSIWEGLLAARNQDFGRWWRQYQKKNNGTGFAERSTDLPTAGGDAGFEGYDDGPVYTSPQLRHPALQGFEYSPIRAILPNIESLAAGGSDASLDAAILDSDGATIYSGSASAAEPAERYPTIEFGEWPNRTWATSFQAEITSHLGTGVTHKTTNVLPLTFEVVARRPLPRGVKL